MTLHPDVLGIDISKQHLDLYDGLRATACRIANDADAVMRLVASLAGRDCLVVFEATGRYDRRLRAALVGAGVAHARVNPEQARHFARATGRRAKTDPIDARMLAELGRSLDPRRTLPAEPARERLCALTRRRDQLVAMRKQERLRCQEEDAGPIADDLTDHIAWLSDAIARVDQAITTLTRDQPDLAHAQALLRSVPGVGPVTAAVLLGQLPELGKRPAKPLTALAGLAPYNNDSGAFRGRRSVRAGRTRVRQALYMAALSVARTDSPLAVFHKRLRDAGKPPKVALIATARKLLTTLNALIKTEQPFLNTTA